MKIYCIGNPYVKEDSAALRIADKLNNKMQKDQVEFVKCYSPEKINFEDPNENKIIIIDVVKDARDIVILRDIDKLKNYSTVSCHGIDLSFHLQLLKSAGKLEGKEILIIGVPKNIDINMLEKNRTLLEFFA